MTRSLIADESFSYPYGRKNLNPGDEFEAESDRDAEILVKARRAHYADETRTKRTYKRRDMTAEQQ